tara:strand:- start:405 stop:848 length:444 start_codon:yes stop_codon:yes gene_type:complete
MDLNKIDEFLSSWVEGVINIGKIHSDGGDYVESAKDFLSRHYAFEETDVLFKPTFTKEMVFRNNKKDALSYFIRGCVSEDIGFALKPWEKIELEELNVLEETDLTAAMGTLLFKPYDSEVTTLVAFTFILKKIDDSFKIKIHHSSKI